MSDVDPGEGYRLLQGGEIIPACYEYLCKGEWLELKNSPHAGERFTDVRFAPLRVRLNAIDNIGVEATTSGPYIAIEVHRAALAEIERLKAELDRRCEIWKLAKDIVAKERDAAEGEVARLKAEVKSIMDGAPSESLDDWVTQDRAPARPEIDERRWVHRNGTASGWVVVGKAGLNGMRHGDVANGDRLELRCRRKDLPPMPEPKPKTATVTFYEYMVRCGVGNEDWQLKWRTSKPKTNNWIPTGRTETREVVR